MYLVKNAPPARHQERRILTPDQLARLVAANAVTRRLRDWNIRVTRIELRDGDARPLVWIERDPLRSIAALLDATSGKRSHAPTPSGCTRFFAMLDDCLIVWEEK